MSRHDDCVNFFPFDSRKYRSHIYRNFLEPSKNQNPMSDRVILPQQIKSSSFMSSAIGGKFGAKKVGCYLGFLRFVSTIRCYSVVGISVLPR